MIATLLTIIIFLAFTSQSWSAPVHDADSNNRGTTVSSVTLSHVVSGSDRILVCGYAVNDATPQPVTGATYNGVAMTRLGSEISTDGLFTYTGAFYLVAPATGTHNAVISTGGGTNGRMFAACTSWTGVDQSTPLGTLVTNSGQTHSSPITDNVSSATGELVIDIAVLYASAATLSVGAGQTLRAEDLNGGNGDDIAISEEAGAGTVTMSWTHGASTPTYSHFAVPLKPVTGGGGSTGFFRRLHQ